MQYNSWARVTHGSESSHWCKQRISAVLMLLSMIFVLPSLSSFIRDFAQKGSLEYGHFFASPYCGISYIIFLLIAFFHMFLGMQVILSDYCASNILRYTGLSFLFVLILLAISGNIYYFYAIYAH